VAARTFDEICTRGNIGERLRPEFRLKKESEKKTSWPIKKGNYYHRNCGPEDARSTTRGLNRKNVSRGCRWKDYEGEVSVWTCGRRQEKMGKLGFSPAGIKKGRGDLTSTLGGIEILKRVWETNAHLICLRKRVSAGLGINQGNHTTAIAEPTKGRLQRGRKHAVGLI